MYLQRQKDIDLLHAFVSAAKCCYIDGLPAHLVDGARPTAKSAILLLLNKSNVTENAREYIEALRKQHIFTTHENAKTNFNLEALVALKNFSSMTPIVGAFLSNDFTFMLL